MGAWGTTKLNAPVATSIGGARFPGCRAASDCGGPGLRLKIERNSRGSGAVARDVDRQHRGDFRPDDQRQLIARDARSLAAANHAQRQLIQTHRQIGNGKFCRAGAAAGGHRHFLYDLKAFKLKAELSMLQELGRRRQGDA